MTTTALDVTRFQLLGFTVLPGRLTAAQSARAFADVDRLIETGTGLRGTRERRSVRNFAATSQVMAGIVGAIDLSALAAVLLGREAGTCSAMPASTTATPDRNATLDCERSSW